MRYVDGDVNVVVGNSTRFVAPEDVKVGDLVILHERLLRVAEIGERDGQVVLKTERPN